MDYNPTRPYIAGNEWSAIRDEDLIFNEQVNAAEYGTTFVVSQPTPIQDVRYYINDWPGGPFYNQAYTAAIYQAGHEAESGPVRAVTIACNSGGVTGSGIAINSPATTVAQALANRGSTPGRGITFTSGVVNNMMTIGFNVNAYAAPLAGKRILGVNLLTEIRVVEQSSAVDESVEIFLELANNTNNASTFWQFQDLAHGNDPPQGTRLQRTDRVGDVALMYGNNTLTTTDMIPWTYTELQKFEATNATPIYFRIYSLATVGSGPQIVINYAALQVFFCEETRVAYGTKMLNGIGTQQASRTLFQYGANLITMKNLAGTASPVLASGSYTVTVSQSSLGDNIEALSNPIEGAQLNALRELYSLPNFDGVIVKLPTQLTELQIGDQAIERTTTSVLPQLSIHTTGGLAPVTEVHSYGRQAIIPVYSGVTADQNIRDDFGAAATYPQVRFYARRWGNTASPLVLTQVAGVPTTQISVAEFDALEEILDGWKAVTLRFGTGPVMGASSFPTFRFSDASDAAGNRWEVLGAMAYAFSGTVGNPLNQVPSAQRLGNTTYGASSGTSYFLNWLSPYVTGATADPLSDATLLFSQDPPTISNLALQALSLTLTGIAADCGGQTPCCIPSAVTYQRLTWSAPVTGYGSFGALELQRYDTVDGQFRTVMMATSSAVTGFNDFEARVGVQSVYRIRTLNYYLFAGAWSTQVTGTVAAPGLTLNCGAASTDNNNGVLIFTSNEAQSGEATLAYAMQFDRAVDESFSFPEADTRTLRRHYQRNFQRAYRPTERGGEAFSRLLLVQAAAGALPNMANIKSLRDLAWQDLSYVCVRDSLGNRWFSNVNVPGNVITQRAIYVAQVDITETNETPTQVNP